MLFSTLVLAMSAAGQSSARGLNGDVRSKMSRLDWRGTLVDFSSLEIIQRTLCWSIQTFCLPREWVDPLTNGNVYLVEFISSLGW